ncbi:CCA tRNA nucleotidyltransferase [Candidatus Peregrinibacteria bacterium]|nr:CCA tRNA nucleotidyltransferase [Candidatus Peregrinibacteria bacterium]
MEKTAIKIVKVFQEAGFEAYFAGGSVRDLLMGNEPKDYDIATSAKPDEIEKVIDAIHLESKTIPIGKEFGVILGIVNGHPFEIATFRSDSSYSDGRRPDAILFTSAKEDSYRRDFTINGMFYDPVKKKVIDFVKGQDDIENKKIRFIGEAHERIKEDHLRILRAVRFKNKFGFEYGTRTKNALEELHHLVSDVSKERIQDELTSILLHPTRAHAMRELDKFGTLEILIPELANCKNIDQPTEFHQEGGVLTHIFKSLHDMPNEWATKELVWAVLLHDIGKPATFEERPDRIHFDGHAQLSAKMADNILRRFKFSRKEIGKITWLIDHHMTVGFIPEMRRAHQVGLFLHPFFEDLMKLHYCDEHGTYPIDLSLYETIMKLYNEFKDEKLLEDHFKPLLTGDDLIKEFKLEQGPKIQQILNIIREEKIEGTVKTKADEKKLVKELLNK